MGYSKKSTEVPKGEIFPGVQADKIFTVDTGLVDAKGALTDGGQAVLTGSKRARAEPFLVGAVAILGVIIVVGIVMSLLRKK